MYTASSISKSNCYIKSIEARPKKERNPNTSVIVVSITPEAKAGSIFNLFNDKGIKIPAIPAINKLSIIASAITIPSKLS